MNTLSVEQLRNWLEEGRALTLVDVRPLAERQEWAIPGSLHIDAYDALKAHDPEALASLDLSAGCAIVTVCAAGKTSRIAAKQLAARGLSQVFSLEGGMQAWSLAWNTADVPLAAPALQVIQVRRTGKGCLSYLIGTEDEATVIDASLEPQVYLDLAMRHGWQITHILDTHLHADHLSRSRQLAEQSGATLFLPAGTPAHFPFTALHDGETLSLAGRRLTALHTPGHTVESACYLLAGNALFTGDTLFLNGVGRPDLAASPAEAEQRAHLLYQSLHRLLALPPNTLILPAHTSAPVPFDGVPLMTTLAEVDEQVDLLHATRATFARTILGRLPATPPNYQRIVLLNKEGLLPEQPVTELEAGANRCAIS